MACPFVKVWRNVDFEFVYGSHMQPLLFRPRHSREHMKYARNKVMQENTIIFKPSTVGNSQAYSFHVHRVYAL